MKTVRYVYWQDEDMWLGYVEDSPDYMTDPTRAVRGGIGDVSKHLTFCRGYLMGCAEKRKPNVKCLDTSPVALNCQALLTKTIQSRRPGNHFVTCYDVTPLPLMALLRSWT